MGTLFTNNVYPHTDILILVYKTMRILLCLFPALTLAEQNTMASDIQLIAEANNVTVCDLYAYDQETCQQYGLLPEFAGFRGFTGFVSTALDPISDYGCWGYFQDNHGKGKGPVQNEVDQMCKVLHDGYECAIFDAVIDGGSCIPWEEEYESGISIGASNVEIECASKNVGNDCAIRACVIEGNFVLSIFAAFFNQVDFNPALKHENGFDNSVCDPAPIAPNPGGQGGPCPD